MYLFTIKTLMLYTIVKLSVAADSSTVPKTQQNSYDIFQRTSFLYGLSTISDEHLIETRCHAHLQLFQRGVMSKQSWALKMFDASASMEPGFTFGNNFWLGNREVCSAAGQPTHLKVSANVPHKMNADLLKSVAAFPIDFRVVYLRHNSSWQLDPTLLTFDSRVHIGLCLPSSCSKLDVQHLMQTYLSTDLLLGNELFDMHLEYDYAKDLKVETVTFKRTSFYLCCIFVLTSVGLTFAAMLFRETECERTPVEESRDNTSTPSHSQAVLNTLQETSFLACFDIQANWRILFAPGKKHSSTSALNGLRFACALCVTLCHYVMFYYTATRNKYTLYNYQTLAGNVDIFVDLFFTISGFLQAYNHFRNVKLLQLIEKNNLKQNLKLIGFQLFHRFLRLAPLYYVTIAFSDFCAKLLDDISLFHIEHKVHTNCEKNWWQNLFFIQNFFNHNDMCGLWTWSLACDMQFSLLATLLLFAFVKQPRRTKLCLVVLVLANIIYTYFNGLKLKIDNSLETTIISISEIYMNPLSRILAYIAGGIAGWLFVRQWRLPLALNKNTQQFLGYLVALLFFGCILKPPFHNLSPLTASSVLVLERIIFALISSMLIVSNARGYMRGVFRVFETSVFQKFNKVAYAMSLLNPILTLALASLSQSSLYANLFNLLFEYIGVVVILVLLSTLFTLLYDIPFQNLSRLLIIKQIKKKLN